MPSLTERRSSFLMHVSKKTNCMSPVQIKHKAMCWKNVKKISRKVCTMKMGGKTKMPQIDLK